MTTVLRSVEIEAPPSEVWAVLADFGAISSWAAFVDHSALMSEQAEGVGTVRRVQSGRTTVIERVMTWDPPSVLTYRFEGLPSIVRSATNTWLIEPRSDGSLVSLLTRIDTGPRPPQRLVGRVLGRQLGQASDGMLAGIKERCS